MPNQFFSPEGDLENYFVTDYWLIDQYVGDTLWAWGDNDFGQLGINISGTIQGRSTPVTTFAGGANWKQVSCGGVHTAAIKTDGTLWVCGSNSFGALGTNNTTARSTPVTTFAGGNDWKQVSCGDASTAAIKTDGTLWVWGDNYSVVLGINNNTDKFTPVTTFAGGTNWKQVSCAFNHMAAIKTDGTLWTWGSNGFGQLGINAVTSRNTPVTTFVGGTNWKQVHCTNGHTAAIKTDGTLWVWGSNNLGQLGINNTVNKSTPVTTFAGGTDWKQSSCGNSYTAAIKTDGTLWTWGTGGSGILGTNNTTSRSTPVTTFAGGNNWKQVDADLNHMAAIKTDGTLWTFGLNSSAQRGTNNTTQPFTPVTTFAGGSNWKQVSCGNGFTAAVTSGTNPIDFIS